MENNMETKTAVEETTEKVSKSTAAQLYANSKDPALTEKIIGEFNGYYNQLKLFYSKNERNEIYAKTNELRLEEMVRLKKVLKYFIKKPEINNDDLRFIVNIFKEMHKKLPDEIKQRKEFTENQKEHNNAKKLQYKIQNERNSKKKKFNNNNFQQKKNFNKSGNASNKKES